MGLYEKMFKVMEESEAIEKSMTVGSGKNAYKAVSEAAMLNAIKPLFKKYKLIIFPIDGEIKDHVMTWDKTDYNGNTTKNLRAVTELRVNYKIVDIETGEFEILIGFGNGADPQDKGAGKAFTYSYKNVLSKTFMLFSGEDADNTHSEDIGKEEKPKTAKQQYNNSTTTGTPKTDIINIETVKELIKVKEVDESKMLEYYKVESLDKMTQSQLGHLKKYLAAK